MTLELGTAHVIVVESGLLTITGTPRGAASSLPEFPVDPTALADAEPIVARPGSVVFAAGSSPYRIVNEGPTVASALFIRIAERAPSTVRPASGAPDTSQSQVMIQIDTLSAAVALPNRKDGWTIEIGRATLTTGTIIPAHDVAGSELIVVEQGVLGATLANCDRQCIRTVGGEGAIASEQQVLPAGHGISVSNGASSAYRIASSTPATLLIVTITPAQA
jgi:hypothetical protein